jgi:hypothetical protein
MYRTIGVLVIVAWLSTANFVYAQCQNPLAEETLNKLRITLTAEAIDLEPGQAFALTLGAAEGCHSFQPIDTCVVWTVEPRNGAYIDERLGILRIDKATPHNTLLIVKANVENGRRELSVKIRVFTREANPLVGYWRQEKLGRDEKNNSSATIEELWFHADGTFSVTWLPFECYHDYWGTYVVDKEKGQLRLIVRGGNYIPPNVDGDGSFVIHDNKRLALNSICLGSPRLSGGVTSMRERQAGSGCSLVFKRVL